MTFISNRFRGYRIVSMLCIGMMILALGCQSETKKLATSVNLSGKTMGTTYSIIYLDEEKRSFRSEIDSVLHQVNQSFSTYIPTSTISIFNQSNRLMLEDSLFIDLIQFSKEVAQTTDGAFDPTVMPLVRYWGFHQLPQPNSIDSSKVDSILQYIGYEKYDLLLSGDRKPIARKTHKNVQLDFNAIAKGYGVDMLGAFLEGRGISNYLIEIGGEMRARGKNAQHKVWTIAIDEPLENNSLQERKFQEILLLENRSIATSGNYRNFYELNGTKVVHTINPKTGFPEISNLLSASVLADNCTLADAYATALMVMGYEKAKTFLDLHSELDGILIYSDENGNLKSFLTDGIKKASR